MRHDDWRGGGEYDEIDVVERRRSQHRAPGKRSVTSQIHTGGGRALPDGVRSKMESSYGADFSGVRVHEGAHVSDLGARAYAQGTDLHFAPGQLDTESQAGHQLIGHELAHVIQQSQGRAAAPAQAKGLPVNREPALEREADELGARAARGEIVHGDGTRRAPLAPPSAAPVQGYWGQEYVEGAANTVREGAEELAGDIASWGADQIDNAAQLLEYIGAVSDALARQMIRELVELNQQILVDFLRSNPAHRLASYIASQLPLAELADLAAEAGQEVREVILGAVRSLQQLPQFFALLYEQSASAARQLVEDIETEYLPTILEACEELGHDLFYEWWPPNTGLEGQVTLAVGAKVPVWPEPPIFVGGQRQYQGEIKLFNKSPSGTPVLEFEVGTQQQETDQIGLFLPTTGAGADVDAREQRTEALAVKTSTHFADIDWNTGLITALRNSDHESAFDALCEGVGNILAATQFQITYKESTAQGIGGSANLGEVGAASASALMGMGFQLTVESPTATQAGKIEAQGQFTAQIAADIAARIPGTPSNIGPCVNYLIRNASAAGAAQASIGGRINFVLPAAPLDNMQAPQFGYVEFFVGSQVSARVGREQGALQSESAIRFTEASLQNFVGGEDGGGIGDVDITDGVTAEELDDMLPFSQLSYKGSVSLDSGLAGLGLRELVAGDSEAVEFLTGQPSVGGKVEVEMTFSKERLIGLLVGLGFVLRDGDDDTTLEGPAVDAIEALRGLDPMGCLAAIGSAFSNYLQFLWGSIDKFNVELHADANHSVGGGGGGIRGNGPGVANATGDVTGSASMRLRAAYQGEFTPAQVAGGMATARAFLQRALPEEIAGYLR